MHVDINLPACCWCSTMWYDGGENVGQQRCRSPVGQDDGIERRNIFKRLPALQYTWSRIRFGLMGVMIESRRAMQLTWIWCIQYAERKLGINLIYLYLLYLSLYVRGLPIFQVLSTVFHISSASFATYPLTGLLTWVIQMYWRWMSSMRWQRCITILITVNNQSDLPLLWTLGWDMITWKPNNYEFNN